jgi:drug/metabolite transporter (DMT)-like permease
LIGPDALEGVGGNVGAQVACLGAALSYAFAGIFGRRFKRLGVAPLTAAVGQVTMSTVVLLVLALAVDRPWHLPPPGIPVWTAVAALAFFSTALAYVLYFRILATAGATNLLLVTLLIPVTAIVLGSFVLGERVDARQFLGVTFALARAGVTRLESRAEEANLGGRSLLCAGPRALAAPRTEGADPARHRGGEPRARRGRQSQDPGIHPPHR